LLGLFLVYNLWSDAWNIPEIYWHITLSTEIILATHE